MGPKVELQKEVQFFIHSRLVLECSSVFWAGGGAVGRNQGEMEKKIENCMCKIAQL